MRLLLLGLLVATSACRTVRPAWHVEAALDETRRTTTEGDVIGGAGRFGGFAWLGIPFAAPPVGERRWKAPQPPPAHAAALTATHFGRACAQPANRLTPNEPEHGGALGDEDCLTLNVWAPPKAEALPVMVWIHGGGNSIGSAAGYDLSNLATRERVIGISVQYRLGPFGWLTHPSLEDGSGGNFGTLDLVRALEWVRDNAKAFGGDPANVTVFGESAGGTNTYSLLLSPKARGLFHRAIAQSPGLSRMSVEQAVEGHPNSSNEVLVRALLKRGAAGRDEAKAKLAAMSPQHVAGLFRGLSPEELVALYQEGAPGTAFMLDFPALFPDGEVLPKDGWYAAFARDGGWNRVPVITGTNRDEAKLFQFVDPRYTWKLFGVLPRIRDEEQYEYASSVVSRLWRASCVDRVAQAMRGSGAPDVWSYRFDWDDEPTRLGTDFSKLLGAAHGVEISFVHGNFDGQLGELLGGDGKTERDALSAKMMDEWGAFARDGRPSAQWTAYEPGEGAPKYLTFDAPLSKVQMASVADTPDAVVEQFLSNAQVSVKDKCDGLQRLVRVGFVSTERAERVTECAPAAQ